MAAWSKRAWRTACGALANRAGFVFVVLVAAVNLFDLFLSLGERAGMRDILGWPLWLWSIGAAFLWILGALFVRLLALEKEREPNIEIDFQEDPPFVITDPLRSKEPAIRQIRVKIINISKTNIDNCLVKMELVKDCDGNEGFFTPIGMITQHQLLQRRKGGVFNLRGEEWKFINIAYLDERESQSEIGLYYETLTGNVSYPNMINRDGAPYILELGVYGAGTKVTQRFKLWVDGGRLRMQPMKET